MTNTGQLQLAEALVFVHGEGAALEAALHARLCERSGDHMVAQRWRKIEGTLRFYTNTQAA